MKKQTLKSIFEAKGLTLKQVSSVSGIPYVTLHQVCSGRRNIGAITAAKLSQALGISLSELRPDLWKA